MQTIVLRTDQPFSLDHTLGCGQAFRWEQASGWWCGVAGGRAIRIRQDGRELAFEGADPGFIREHFQLDLDLNAVLASFDRDPVIGSAVRRCRGLRILLQEPWECLISYICATNTNIPAVKKRVALLAQEYGSEIIGGAFPAFAFPAPGELAGACNDDLRLCRLGYRAPYVCETIERIAADPGWEERLSAMPYEEARRELMSLKGVGPKAADCVLLFAFGKYEAFPVDVWIRRIMVNNYLPELERERGCTPGEYDRIAGFAREYFGAYAGYAQEYLYCARAE